MHHDGYVSIGHLLVQTESPSQEECMAILRQFFTILSGSSVPLNGGIWKFDQFFESIEYSLENMTKLLRGILKDPQVDDLTFQLGIEGVVWGMIGSSYDPYSGERMSGDHIFRLFCIFNRLCNPATMLLSQKIVSYSLGKALEVPTFENGLTFENLVSGITTWPMHEGFQSTDCGAIVKKAYDAYVRDVIIEARIKIRFPYKGSPLPGRRHKDNQLAVSVTSGTLKVYEDEDLAVQDKREQTGEV